MSRAEIGVPCSSSSNPDRLPSIGLSFVASPATDLSEVNDAALASSHAFTFAVQQLRQSRVTGQNVWLLTDHVPGDSR